MSKNAKERAEAFELSHHHSSFSDKEKARVRESILQRKEAESFAEEYQPLYQELEEEKGAVFRRERRKRNSRTCVLLK